jgi:hypothetical protein
MHRRRIVGDRITYVGLDKEGIVVAVAEGGIRGEVREYSRIANTAGALNRLMRKLGGEGVRLCQQLSGLLLRQGCHYGRPAWTKLHLRWLAGLKFEQAAHYIVLDGLHRGGRSRRSPPRSTDDAD